MLSGNATFSTAELKQLTNNAAGAFYQTTGSLTFAMRKAAENINAVARAQSIHTGRGQYALGYLMLAAIRKNNAHYYSVAQRTGSGSVMDSHVTFMIPRFPARDSVQVRVPRLFIQVELHPQDLLVLCGNFPRDWEADLLNQRPPASLEASYRKLTLTKGDLDAVLIQAQSGHGTITVFRPEVNLARQAARIQILLYPPFARGGDAVIPGNMKCRTRTNVERPLTATPTDTKT